MTMTTLAIVVIVGLLLVLAFAGRYKAKPNKCDACGAEFVPTSPTRFDMGLCDKCLEMKS